MRLQLDNGRIAKKSGHSETCMNPIGFALVRPKTVLVALISLVLVGLSVIRPKSVDDWLKTKGIELPIRRMAIDM